MPWRRRILGLLVTLLIVAAQPAAALNVEQLLGQIARAGGQDIAFEESRFLNTLMTPLISRGRLIYEPPDRLIKLILEPRRESAVFDEDRLAILDGEDKEIASIDLWMQPDLRLTFDSIIAMLTGDVERLCWAFWITLDGDEEDWCLKLVPKIDASKSRVENILVSGRGDQLLSFDFRQSDGDRSLIRLLPETAAQ